MNTYMDILERLLKGRDLGDGYELREVKRWTVHCTHCGVQLIGDTPQTDKALEALRRQIADRSCRNPNCVSRGGNERRRTPGCDGKCATDECICPEGAS